MFLRADQHVYASVDTAPIALLDLLTKMSAAGHAQFLVATHSPILLSCPGATIYSFDHAPIAPIPYEQTDHYNTYKSFMDDRQK